MPQDASSDGFDEKVYQRAYRAKHRERLRKQARAYYEANKERINAANRARYARNRECCQRAMKRYAQQNREKIACYQREYRERNAQRLRKQAKERYRKNAAEWKRKVWERNNRSPHHRMIFSLRRRVSQCVRRRSGRDSSLVLSGCSVPEFLGHIERQFPPGCNWENYGRIWHVDHIIPCASFDLRDPRQLRQCFHFSNLRPLRARENLSKNKRITEPQLKLLL